MQFPPKHRKERFLFTGADDENTAWSLGVVPGEERGVPPGCLRCVRKGLLHGMSKRVTASNLDVQKTLRAVYEGPALDSTTPILWSSVTGHTNFLKWSLSVILTPYLLSTGSLDPAWQLKFFPPLAGTARGVSGATWVAESSGFFLCAVEEQSLNPGRGSRRSTAGQPPRSGAFRRTRRASYAIRRCERSGAEVQ